MVSFTLIKSSMKSPGRRGTRGIKQMFSYPRVNAWIMEIETVSSESSPQRILYCFWDGRIRDLAILWHIAILTWYGKSPSHDSVNLNGT